MADYATLLRDHVTLKCRSIDRIFLQAYVGRYGCRPIVRGFIFLRFRSCRPPNFLLLR